MDETSTIIKESLEKLPSEIQTYIRNKIWIKDIDPFLEKHSLTPEQAEGIKSEILLYLLALQNKQGLTQEIKNVLRSLPTPICTLIVEELLTAIPEKIQDVLTKSFEHLNKEENTSEQDVPAQEKKVLQNTQEKKDWDETKEFVPELEKNTEQRNESGAGVDIIPEEIEHDDQTTLQKNSLINSIEHPEKTTTNERKEGGVRSPQSFNPIASKLSASTSSSSSDTTSYAETDPYREPIS